ncbi:MAG TPA: hypothetical protein VD968_16040, partial [Pyrinomonadaceae bacterium]|nr:hypothetical protein [Pyrinomonadaceae bacterium]
MRILFVTQIYLPEMGALPNRLYPLARRLAESGHEVFVATGMPNYPKFDKAGKFHGYRGSAKDITVEYERKLMDSQ